MAEWSLFPVEAKALLLSERRAELLAENMVNASTPNYVPRDFDFKTAMTNNGALINTHDAETPTHLAVNEGASGVNIQPVVEQTNSYDGNAVDINQERVKFMKNSLVYQSSLSFITSRLKNVLSAIKGE